MLLIFLGLNTTVRIAFQNDSLGEAMLCCNNNLSLLLIFTESDATFNYIVKVFCLTRRRNNKSFRANHCARHPQGPRVYRAGPRVDLAWLRVDLAGPRVDHVGPRVDRAGPRVDRAGLRLTYVACPE